MLNNTQSNHFIMSTTKMKLAFKSYQLNRFIHIVLTCYKHYSFLNLVLPIDLCNVGWEVHSWFSWTQKEADGCKWRIAFLYTHISALYKCHTLRMVWPPQLPSAHREYIHTHTMHTPLLQTCSHWWYDFWVRKVSISTRLRLLYLMQQKLLH